MWVALCALACVQALDLRKVRGALVAHARNASNGTNGTVPIVLRDGRVVRLSRENVTCFAPSTNVGFFGTVSACAEAISANASYWGHRGLLFSYGKGEPGSPFAGACLFSSTSSETCPEGLSGTSEYNWYAIDTLLEETGCKAVHLVRANASCGSSETILPPYGNLTSCGMAVAAAGGTYFTYGQIGTTGEGLCRIVHTSSASCPEGLVNDDLVGFYSVLSDESKPALWISQGRTSPAAGKFVELIRGGYTCNSSDAIIGTYSTLRECAELVAMAGGKFLDYSRTGVCRLELANFSNCTEGWIVQPDTGFYGIGAIPLTTDFANMSMPPCLQPLVKGAEAVRTKVTIGNFDFSRTEEAGLLASVEEQVVGVLARAAGTPEANIRAVEVGAGSVIVNADVMNGDALMTGTSTTAGAITNAVEGIVNIAKGKSEAAKPVVVSVAVETTADFSTEPNVVVPGVGASLMREPMTTRRDLGKEALDLAKATHARIMDIRAGLLRASKAHAAALKPQDAMDITGTRKLAKKEVYEWGGPLAPYVPMQPASTDPSNFQIV
jgi:hypothetical protein